MWLIGKRAHAPGRHVQQVVGIAGRIGETRSESAICARSDVMRVPGGHVAEKVPAE